jgi:inhibitor of cysteine peptidase
MTPFKSSALFVSAFALFVCAPLRAQTAADTVSDLSVWHAPSGALDAIRKQCGAGAATDIQSCFIAAMKQQGASNSAIAFAQSMAASGQIYLKAFRKTGAVSIGYFEYVFRANETEGVAIVNGDPSPIDVDDPQYLTSKMLAANAVYQQLAGKYPNISSWPGDRTSPGLPEVRQRDAGGTQVLVRYLLKNGCHACANVGSARVAFNFNAAAKFEGAHLMNVIPGAPPSSDQPTERDPAGTGLGNAVTPSRAARRTQPAARLVTTSYQTTTPAPQNANTPATETLPLQELHAKSGEDITITLEGNRTTGYSWQLATKLDSKLLKKVSETFTPKNPGTPGSGENNLFIFHCQAKGSATLTFHYSRPWEKNAPPAKTATYHITIE